MLMVQTLLFFYKDVENIFIGILKSNHPVLSYLHPTPNDLSVHSGSTISIIQIIFDYV